MELLRNWLSDKKHAPDSLDFQIPPGYPIGGYFIRWKQKDGGETLHPRYVLTNLGGVRIEHGLDEGKKDGEITDISLLDHDI